MTMQRERVGAGPPLVSGPPAAHIPSPAAVLSTPAQVADMHRLIDPVFLHANEQLP